MPPSMLELRGSCVRNSATQRGKIDAALAPPAQLVGGIGTHDFFHRNRVGALAPIGLKAKARVPRVLEPEAMRSLYQFPRAGRRPWEGIGLRRGLSGGHLGRSGAVVQLRPV